MKILLLLLVCLSASHCYRSRRYRNWHQSVSSAINRLVKLHKENQNQQEKLTQQEEPVQENTPVEADNQVEPQEPVKQDVEYLLYTRSVENQDFYLSDTEQLEKVYDPSLMTYFIIHGWNGGDFKDSWGEDVTNALLKHEACNVIYVRWKEWATNINYLEAKGRADDTGTDLSQFIRWLEATFGAKRSKMHLIGHSLGGQVAGFAGAQLKSPKIARITGLDTSGIGFNCLFNKNDCLDPSDAEFVDEIHTLISALPRGHADFYPMPTNAAEIIVNPKKVVEAHFLGADYFVKSLEAGTCAFKATQCQSFDTLKKGGCALNDVNNLGFYAKKPSGSPPNRYFLTVDLNKPC